MLPSEATGTDESENVGDAKGSKHLLLSLRDNAILWISMSALKNSRFHGLHPLVSNLGTKISPLFLTKGEHMSKYLSCVSVFNFAETIFT